MIKMEYSFVTCLQISKPLFVLTLLYCNLAISYTLLHNVYSNYSLTIT